MNLTTHHEKMLNLMDNSATFSECVSSFLGCKGFVFCDRDLKNPLESDPRKVYLIQIASHFNGRVDNTHSIVIFNHKLYDVNHPTPLSLTKDNLDLCCVGDDWKFDHISRVVSLLPSKKMEKNLH